MRSKKSAITWAGLGLVGLVLIGWLTGVSFGASSETIVVDPQIAGPPTAETGVWRTKAQPVFDPIERTLVRRMYMVWDPVPSRDLDFVWIPDSPHDDRAGKINGLGRLIWRLKGKPTYDRASIFARTAYSCVDRGSTERIGNSTVFREHSRVLRGCALQHATYRGQLRGRNSVFEKSQRGRTPV